MRSAEQSSWDMNGNRFYSRSAFQSGFFVVATLSCCAALVAIVWVAVHRWQEMTLATPTVLLFAAAFIVRSWIAAFRAHQEVRVLVQGELLKAESDEPVAVVLDAGARTLNDGLFFGALTIIVLVLFVGHLLGRA